MREKPNNGNEIPSVKDLFIINTCLSFGFVKRVIIQDDTGALHDFADLKDEDYNRLLASFGLLILSRPKGTMNIQTKGEIDEKIKKENNGISKVQIDQGGEKNAH